MRPGVPKARWTTPFGINLALGGKGKQGAEAAFGQLLFVAGVFALGEDLRLARLSPR